MVKKDFASFTCHYSVLKPHLGNSHYFTPHAETKSVQKSKDKTIDYPLAKCIVSVCAGEYPQTACGHVDSAKLKDELLIFFSFFFFFLLCVPAAATARCSAAIGRGQQGRYCRWELRCQSAATLCYAVVNCVTPTGDVTEHNSPYVLWMRFFFFFLRICFHELNGPVLHCVVFIFLTCHNILQSLV